MNPNLVGRLCHNRIKDIYCLTSWIPKRSVTRWVRVPPTRTSTQLTLFVSEGGTESSASSASTGPDEADSTVDDEEDFESNVLSVEFEPHGEF